VLWDEVPVLQFDGSASVATAQVGHYAVADAAISDSLPRVPYAGLCLGAPGSEAAGGGRGAQAGAGKIGNGKQKARAEVDLMRAE
jgi:hypothetical protein